jgi:hypothetical protein
MGNCLTVSRSPPAVTTKNVTLEDDPTNAPSRRPPVPPRNKSNDKDLQMRNVIDVHSRKYEAAERKESVVSDDKEINILPMGRHRECPLRDRELLNKYSRSRRHGGSSRSVQL